MKTTTRCLVAGCPNPVVRVLVHVVNPDVRGGICQFHGQTFLKYATDEQVREYVFPKTNENGRPVT